MATFQVAAVYSNHMVLQRNKNTTIFGYGQDGEKVSAVLYNSKGEVLNSNSTTTLKERWEIQFAPQTAQENCKITVNCGNSTVTFEDVSIGEVWLAGGQSNMEFELQNCVEGPEELKNEKAPGVRFYYTNKIAWQDEAFYTAEKNTCWQTWDSQWKGSWSAVGYFFAKKLAKELGCTVGVIGCNWGGTSASAWMRKEYLEIDSELNTYLTEQEEATKGKSIEQQCKEYDDYTVENDEWQKGYSKLWEKDHSITWDDAQKILGTNPWPGPRSCKNPYRPTGLYDCMLSRIIPYTLKGVIWYQGESDDHKPNMYAKLFSTMIDNWRTDWKDNSLPFVFVQLPEHRYQQDKDFKHWCLIREAQEKVHATVKNAYMTVALDLGKFSDIHPTQKEQLGYRMAANALSTVYEKGNKEDVLSPTLASTLISENIITLTFENAAEGFEVREDTKELDELKMMEANQGNTVPEDFTGFEIAGADGVYYPAEFAFGGTDGSLNTISLCSKKVPEPKFARYAWYNYGPVTIFAKKSKLPLAPFRTSINDSSAATEHAAIQQIMTV